MSGSPFPAAACLLPVPFALPRCRTWWSCRTRVGHRVGRRISPVSSPARLVEVHMFSFVVGRAFVTDVEKLRIYSKGNSLNVTDIIKFFIEVRDGISYGSNLLHAVEVLVTGYAIDKQPLLDSAILCCLIHILSVLLNPDKSKGEQMDTLEESNESENRMDDKEALHMRQLEVN
ncbi:unnamed protein product [Musa textilis]